MKKFIKSMKSNLLMLLLFTKNCQKNVNKCQIILNNAKKFILWNNQEMQRLVIFTNRYTEKFCIKIVMFPYFEGSL